MQKGYKQSKHKNVAKCTLQLFKKSRDQKIKCSNNMLACNHCSIMQTESNNYYYPCIAALIEGCTYMYCMCHIHTSLQRDSLWYISHRN